MKTFALTALAAIGLAFTAGTADAQFRSRSVPSYNYPSTVYNYPSTVYPSAIYNYPSVTYSSYAPAYTGIVTSNYYSPYSGSVVTPAGFTTTYSTPYYSAPYYSTPYSNSYGGMYRGRGWRR
ncbi:hypothetical protein R5W23_000494 [Gemmata sp. JC673]|uniref:Uncharacterized protein n=1 Tax=Gemmata algarum TaxID=2975278 RepID=A0ABU5EWF5_9BACT|nr:hypothetical protein [Gemmata algarum]MDY3559501.1 hypothetical protein [Gemmata algarum]